jgi:isopenicillin N synthase-like dioxygenase
MDRSNMQQQLLPVLDFELCRSADPNRRAAFAADLRAACTTSGFFYLGNVGLRAGLATEALGSARAFFALPLAEKRSIDIANSPHFRGYAELGRETTAHKLDLREQIDFGLEAAALPLDAAAAAAAPYLRVCVGPNQWPAAPAGFRPTLTGWFEACAEVRKAPSWPRSWANFSLS